MKLKLAAGLMITGLLFTSKVLKSQAIAPQLWSNVGVAWNISDRFSWRNTAAFNALLSSEFPWFETTLTSTAVYKFHRYMEASAGVYTARTKQTVSLSSYELRPFVGFRISTNDEKRWKISNLSRLELRRFIYSDINNDIAFRFRNRTYATVSLTKSSVSTSKNILLVFAYFEAFFNFGQEVRERFFNQFKYKLGLAYRLNESWGLNLGFIYQDAKTTVVLPAQAPTNLITKYVFEWGLVYIIGSNKKKN
ncbi:MAG: DUF2490 domain-containing protein [Bacteroidales bacterium]|nr:DUF2490 domain-containing protein [Bacteroidales bacterium]